MENQNQNTSVIFPRGSTEPTATFLGGASNSDNSLSLTPVPLQPSNTSVPPPKKSENLLLRLVKRADVVLAVLLVLGSLGLVLNAMLSSGQKQSQENSVNDQFDPTQIPLSDFVTDGGIDFGSQSVTINGALLVNDAFILTPSQQPTSAVAGQMYYDQTSNVLAYYNGTQFIPMAGSSAAAIQSAGAGLTLTGTQISNSGVLSIQGQTGDVTLGAGNGIGISGTTISNTGVVNLVSTDSTLVVTNDGSGNYELTVNLGGAGVTSLNGLAGVLTLANASGAGSTVTIDDASTAAKGIAQFNPANFSAAGGIVNTIQNIGTGATPTFAGVNTNSITPSAALTVGATGQQLTLQGNASTQLTATSGGFATTLGFSGSPIANVTYNIDRSVAAGTYTLCSTIGNCAGSGSGVTSSGGAINRLAKFTASQNIENSTITDNGTSVTTTVDMVIQGGDLTVGVPSVQTGTINLAHSGSAFFGSFVQGALTDNRSYLLPDAGGTLCLSIGNCSGSGSTSTLQAAYDAGNTITTSDNRSLIFTLADTATDSNFLVNLECDTACGANGRFAIQDDGTDIVTVVPASMTLGTNVDLFLQGASAFISNPQGQTASESFGLNATVTGANAVAFGNGATAALDAVAIGQGANAVASGIAVGQGATASGSFGGPIAIGDGAVAASWGVAIGSGSSTSGNWGTAIGNDARVTAQTGTAIGEGTRAAQGSIAIGSLANSGGNNRIVIGNSAAGTADNQLVLGGSSAAGSYITNAYIGSGVTDTTPQSVTLQATGGSGSNIAGANFNLAGGRGTGSANGGNLNFQVTTPGGAGSSLNTLSTVFSLQGTNGSANFINAVNSTQAFNVETAAGANLLTVDTTNNRVGINLGGSSTPTLASGIGGAEINGALRISGLGTTTWDNYTTPVGSSILAKVNIVNQTMNPFGQIMAFGLTSGSSDSARGLSLFDARTVTHQPTLAVFSPDENSMVGFSWNGSNSSATVQTNDQASGSSDSFVLQSGNATGSGVGSGNVVVTSGSVQGGTGGSTGTLTLQSGNGAGTNTSSGNLLIDAGTRTGSGTAGTITIGGTNASALTLGRTGLATNNAGSLNLGQLGTTDNNAFVCRNSSNILAACSGTGTGAAFMQGGNSFSGTAVLGTNDSNSLTLETNNATQVTIAVGGAATFQNTTNSSDAFRILNAAGTGEHVGVDTTDSILRLLANNTGHLSGTAGSWNTATALPAARAVVAAVSVNGYVYSIGGCDSGSSATATVYYARANSDGTLGSWTATTSLPNAACGHAATTYNGYIYVHGSTGTAATSRDVAYAKPNADGTISSWTTQNDPTNLIDLKDHGMTSHNGYLYIVGGQTEANVRNRNIYYGKIMADGSVPSFSVQTNWLNDQDHTPGQAIAANGFLYVMGSANYDKFYYGRINADGTVAANALASNTTDSRKYASITVMNGYMYAIMGGVTPTNTVQYGALASSGDIGAFATDTTTTPATRWLCPKTAVTVNSYIYVFGCADATDTAQTSVYYAGGSRVKVGGGLDLVGYSGESMSDGGTGGQLTAGNTFVNGTLSVTGNTSLKDGATVGNALNVTGTASVQNTTNTTTGFQVLNASAVPQFVADTTNSRIYIGNPTADSTGALLVLDTKNTSGDPTGVNGAMYYSSYLGTMRCYEQDQWIECLGAPKPNTNRTTQMVANGDTDVWTGYGDVLVNTAPAGSGGSLSSNLVPSVYNDTAASIGSQAGVEGGNIYSGIPGHRLVYQTHLDTSDTSVRVWAGLTTEDLATMAASATPTGSFAAFRYDTGAGDTTWQCITRDGVSATTTNSGIARVDDQKFEVALDDGTRAIFKINGQIVCTVNTTVPSGNIYRVVNSITALNAAVKTIYVGWIYVEGDPI